MSYEMVSNQERLDELCQLARETQVLGMDTEFLWERTYAPQICLVQIAVDDRIALVDPLEPGIDLQPIADVIADDSVDIVMHAPHADLVAFCARHDIVPTRVFDTQIAAGFVGLSAGLAYDRLVEQLLHEKLPPSESFTDWSRRPLNERQLHYAADDVIYLFGMEETLHERLTERGRLDWALEEMDRRFGRGARLMTPPERAYEKVSRRNRLRPQEMAVLREVAAWRELSARRRDLPVSWVMKDQTAIEVARRAPATARDLGSIRGIDSGLRSKDRDLLIEAIERGQHAEPIEPAKEPPAPVRRRVSVAKGPASAVLRARCDDAELASELVATTADLEALVRYISAHDGELPAPGTDFDDLPALLKGWRREVVGDELVDLLEGRISLRLSATPPFMSVSPD